MVWPMVAAGTSNDEILAARDIAPDLATAMSAGRICDASRQERDMTISTPCPCWSRTSPASWPASPACSPGAASTSTRSRSARPSTPRSRGSRSWSTSRSTPLEQVTKQLNKLINVLKIVELEQEQAVQRELLLVKVRADADEPAARCCETVELFRAKVVDVAPTR